MVKSNRDNPSVSATGRCAGTVAAITALACAVVSGSAAAQWSPPVDGVIRISEENGKFETEAPVRPESPIWDAYDLRINPLMPDLGNRARIAEQLVYEIVSYVSGVGSLEKAENAALELVTFCPDRPGAHYNLACVFALRGKHDEAIAALGSAIDLGWRNERHIALDSHLDPIRKDERFIAHMARLADLIRAETPTFTPLRVDSLETIVADLEAHVPAIMAHGHIPGVSIAVVRDGKVCWTGAFGEIDARTEQPVSQDTLFLVDGPSRLLTSIVAMQLHERETWDLDEPLARWASSLRFGSLPFAKNVTIRRTLNFTAGLVAARLDEIADGVDDEINRSILVDPDRVGRRYTYAPESYLAVGRAIERAISPVGSADPVEAESYDGYFGERLRGGVLLPLRMTSTFQVRPTRDRTSVAVGHTEYGTPYVESVRPRKPAAAVYTTAADLGKALELMVGRYADTEKPVLTEQSIAAMYEPGLDPAPVAGQNWHFGLGMKVTLTEAGPCAEIAEVRQGVGALMRWYPESDCGIVVLFNRNEGLPAAERIAHLALGGM